MIKELKCFVLNTIRFIMLWSVSYTRHVYYTLYVVIVSKYYNCKEIDQMIDDVYFLES